MEGNVVIVLTNTARLVQHEHHVHIGITHWRRERGREREGGRERETN
jgi:hypothetical protein